MAPLVSIILPTHNRAYTLPRALASLYAQTYQDFEILVVDDASTDHTRDILSHAQDPRLRVLTHSVNRGGSAARNTGIEAARGDYIGFLDSDDEWKPGKLQTQISRMNAVADGSMVLFSSLLLRSPSAERALPLSQPRDAASMEEYILGGHGLVHLITLLVPAPLARKVRFDESLPCNQDTDFTLRLAQAGARFEFISEPLAIWHHDRDDHVGWSTNYQPLINWINQQNVSDHLKTRFLAAVVARRALLAGDRRAALPYLLRGLVSGSYNWREFAGLAAYLVFPRPVADTMRLAGTRFNSWRLRRSHQG